MTTIQELERRIAAGEMMASIAKSTGVTRQCVSERIRRAKAARGPALDLSELEPGDMVREKDTGKRWQYVGPSARSADSARIATEGGVHSMDMSLTRLERIIAPSAVIDTTAPGPNEPVVVFSLARGDNPNDPRFRAVIDRAMEVRNTLDREKHEVRKSDPDANLR